MVDILNLQRSTTRYEFADGIRDFQSAVWMLIIGFYMWLFWEAPQVWMPAFNNLADSQSRTVAGLVMFALVIGLPLALVQGSQRLVNEYVRRRWLWRNTGFIKPKSWLMPRTTLALALTVMFVVFIAGILAAIQFREWQLIWRFIYLGTGLELGLMYFMTSQQLQLARYRVVAGAGVAGTIVIVLLQLSLGLAGLLTMLLWAGLLIGSGIYGMREVAAVQQGLADES